MANQNGESSNWWKTFMMGGDKWFEDMKANLSMVTALISAITFQAALNSPGGVVQTSTGPENTPIGCNSAVGENNICTGEAVLAVVHSVNYLYFIKFNTFSFVASLSAALLLVSGIPLKYRFLMWFLSITMSASLTSLAVTYLFGVLLVAPDPVHDEALQSFKKFMWVWIGLLLLYILYITIHILDWFEEKKLGPKQASPEEKRTSSVPQEINTA